MSCVEILLYSGLVETVESVRSVQLATCQDRIPLTALRNVLL